MKKILLSLVALALVGSGLVGFARSFPSQIEGEKMLRAARERHISLDVACDCRTFSFNRGATPPDLVRGDGFIVNGKVFPGGTLPEGPSSIDPNDPGSIGDWICHGTLTGAAADPVAFVTQYHLLADGGGLVSDGTASGVGGQLAVVGGLGSLSGASGEMSALAIGTNITGCPNIRFTIRLKRQAPR